MPLSPGTRLGTYEIGGQIAAAIEAARRAVSLNPRLPEAHKAEALNLNFAGTLEPRTCRATWRSRAWSTRGRTSTPRSRSRGTRGPIVGMLEKAYERSPETLARPAGR